MRRLVQVLVGGVLVIGLALLLTVLLFDLDRYRGDVEARLAQTTGRSVQIDGGLALGFGLPPALRISGLRIGNADWGTAAAMAEVEDATVRVAPWALLRGKIRVRDLRVNGARLLLEVDADGRGNWEFAAPGKRTEGAPGPLPEIGRIAVKNFDFSWRDGRTGRSESVHLLHLEALPENGGEALRFEFALDYAAERVVATGRVGGVHRLRDAQAYPVELNLALAGADLALSGTLDAPLDMAAIDLGMRLQGGNLGRLGAVIGVSLPPAPFRGDATLTGGGGRYRVEATEVEIGGSDLAAEFDLDLSAARFDARLDSGLLDLNALLPVRSEGDGAAASGPLFSADPFPERLLPAAEGRIVVQLARVRAGALVFDGVEFDAEFGVDGSGRAGLTAAIGGGRVDAGLHLTESGPRVAVDLDARAVDIDLGGLLENVGRARDVDMPLEGELRLAGRGHSMAELASSLNGHALVLGGEGRVNNAVLAALSSDLLGSLAPFLDQRDSAALNCMAGRFDVRDGVAVTHGLLFDTQTVTLGGTGQVDLGRERVAMVFTPRPKQAGLMNLAVPLEVYGPLQRPEVRLERGGLVRRSAGIALAAVNPLVLLVPVVTTTFGGDRNPCLAAVEEARSGTQADRESRMDGFMRGLQRGLQRAVGRDD